MIFCDTYVDKWRNSNLDINEKDMTDTLCNHLQPLTILRQNETIFDKGNVYIGRKKGENEEI